MTEETAIDCERCGHAYTASYLVEVSTANGAITLCARCADDRGSR